MDQSKMTVAAHREAVQRLLTQNIAPHHVNCTLAEVRGNPVLAYAVTCPIDLPPFDNSQMDGYAVRLKEARSGPVKVAAAIAAGAPPRTLEPGTAAPIMTGAPIPCGADAVVRIEACLPDKFDSTLTEVNFDPESLTQVEPGTYVRWQGSDAAKGTVLLEAGTRIGPAQMGVLANAGITDVSVVSPLRVGIISSGDELANPGAPLLPGQVYNANSLMLRHALQECGALVAFELHLPDSCDDFEGLWASHAEPCDLLISTAGVSKGAFEVVKEVFSRSTFYDVDMQPGGPQGIGLLQVADGGQIPVLHFPGNPVSALISFEMFLRALIRAWHGMVPQRGFVDLPITTSVTSIPKHQVRRARVIRDDQDNPIAVELVGGVSSHLLNSYAASDALVHLDAETLEVKRGDMVLTWLLDRVSA